jgi:hypothetical protein
MKKMLILLLSTCFHATGWATSQSYDYPFEDKFLSTVIGTPQEYRPELPKVIPVTKGLLTVFEDREPPEWFWYEDGLRYSYALQDDPAPLVFLIAGTGGSHSGAKIINMARAFYSAGFHTVMLSSPTHSNFIVTASHSSVPGHAMNDAEDLYRVRRVQRGFRRLPGRRTQDVQVQESAHDQPAREALRFDFCVGPDG